MTKEELEKEANKFADENATPDLDYSFRVDIFEASKEGYLAGAEPREKRIADLEDKLANADYQFEGRDNEIRELKDEVRKLKLLVSSLVYEINQIWDINEMNDDLRMCAEKIDREVQLSKMAEDNRMVISALGFAIVPPKPKLDVKEV